jgi:predicted NACHT family NTPase
MSLLLELLLVFGKKVVETTGESTVRRILGSKKTPRLLRNSVPEETQRYEQHEEMVRAWASKISFNELNTPKRLLNSFVDLDLHLGPVHETFARDERYNKKVSEIVTEQRHFIIIGDAGAGKTTSLKRIALDVLHREKSPQRVLLILLREKTDASVSGAILTILGVTALIDTEEIENKAVIEREMVLQRLRRHPSWVLIDGLDEIPPSSREAIISELRFLLMRPTNSNFVITSRSGDFHWHFEDASVFAILPLSDDQITEFTNKWLGSDVAAEFREKIKHHPYGGLEVRPLTLAHLCAIFERTGKVPEKPRFVYRMIVQLLLEEWDAQRSVRRYSEYANFDVRRKGEFLEAIAYEISIHGTSVFSQLDLEQAFSRHCSLFGLSRHDAPNVAEEISSHTGLIIKTAYGKFSFAHKVIQEYLAAWYLLKLDSLKWERIRNLPSETALLVALSSNPNRYFARVFSEMSRESATTHEVVSFAEPFVDRLLVERVDFSTEVEFGASVIGIFSAALGSAERNPGPRLSKQISSPMSEFLKVAAVQSSIAEFLASAQVKEINPDLFEVTARIRSHQSGSLGIKIARTFRINAALWALLNRTLDSAETFEWRNSPVKGSE